MLDESSLNLWNIKSLFESFFVYFFSKELVPKTIRKLQSFCNKKYLNDNFNKLLCQLHTMYLSKSQMFFIYNIQNFRPNSGVIVFQVYPGFPAFLIDPSRFMNIVTFSGKFKH